MFFSTKIILRKNLMTADNYTLDYSNVCIHSLANVGHTLHGTFFFLQNTCNLNVISVINNDALFDFRGHKQLPIIDFNHALTNNRILLISCTTYFIYFA